MILNFNIGNKELHKSNILENEKKSIKRWTSKADHYKNIKKVAFNKYNKEEHVVSDSHIKWFEGLESLFINYLDNTSHFSTIFRVDIIDNTFNMELSDEELFKKFCNSYEIDSLFSFDDIICSFSADLDCANEASKNSKKYRGINTPQVIYILEKRYSKYLYIEEFSETINEEEVLTITFGTFKVNDIQFKEYNTVEIYIDEVLKL